MTDVQFDKAANFAGVASRFRFDQPARASVRFFRETVGSAETQAVSVGVKSRGRKNQEDETDEPSGALFRPPRSEAGSVTGLGDVWHVAKSYSPFGRGANRDHGR